jgi:hypothetical protein
MKANSLSTLLEVTENSCRELARKREQGQSLTPQEVSFAESLQEAATNTIEPLCHGLESLGEVMTLTLSSDECIPKHTVAGLGWLVVTTAQTLDRCWRIHEAVGCIFESDS